MPVEYHFAYNKKKVIQALRYHFTARPEIRILVIAVNVFALMAAVLLALKKISPQPFLLSSLLWFFLMITFWFLLPLGIYSRSQTFKEQFTIFFYTTHIHLETSQGYTDWRWEQIQFFMESPYFFHLYFNSKSFFLIPKDSSKQELMAEIKGLLKQYLKRK
jgi:hypothetical protein